MEGASFSIFPSSLGWVLAVARSGELICLENRVSREDCESAQARRWADAADDPEAPPLPETRKQLDEYLAGRRREFDLPLGVLSPDSGAGTEFQRSVWAELLRIPFGATTTYGEIARTLGVPGGARAVGMANHDNPIGVVIPCHRVIGANGALTGYAGGLPMKQRLLELEGALPGRLDFGE